jgi:hypothetical protein
MALGHGGYARRNAVARIATGFAQVRPSPLSAGPARLSRAWFQAVSGLGFVVCEKSETPLSAHWPAD